ncbi:hypothetical protein DIPPA_22781 [Diplonema papillatum]|nr:hypothetical protein DIPPA_22781 [Diplonema papillatum]
MRCMKMVGNPERSSPRGTPVFFFAVCPFANTAEIACGATAALRRERTTSSESAHRCFGNARMIPISASRWSIVIASPPSARMQGRPPSERLGRAGSAYASASAATCQGSTKSPAGGGSAAGCGSAFTAPRSGPIPGSRLTEDVTQPGSPLTGGSLPSASAVAAAAGGGSPGSALIPAAAKSNGGAGPEPTGSAFTRFAGGSAASPPARGLPFPAGKILLSGSGTACLLGGVYGCAGLAGAPP